MNKYQIKSIFEYMNVKTNEPMNVQNNNTTNMCA